MEVSYSHVCINKSDIPVAAIEHLDADLTERLGGSFSSVFPMFSEEFKLTSKIIERDWSAPVLVLEKGVRNWLKYILIQAEDKNLFFGLQPVFMEKEGEIFEEDHEMLPNGWKEIYRWFNSFCITGLDYSPSDWWNTPFRYESRLDLDDYERGSGTSRKQTEKLAQDIGCSRSGLRCWLLTEAGDALFINEEACDRKVYHVKGKDLVDFIPLPNPEQKLDLYLSHLLQGFSPKDFYWRE